VLTTSAIDLLAGDFVVVIGTYYGSLTNCVLDTSDADLTFFQHYNVTDGWPSNLVRGMCRITANKSGAVIRMTLGASVPNRALSVYVIRPEANYRVQCHAFLENGNTGNGTSVTTSAINTYGDDVAIIGALFKDNTGTVSNVQIAGVNATVHAPASRFRTCYAEFEDNVSNATMTATLSASSQWAAFIMSVKCVDVAQNWPSIRFNTAGDYGNDSAYCDNLSLSGVLVTTWVRAQALSGDYPRGRGNLYPFRLLGPTMDIYVIGCNYQIQNATSFASVYNFHTTMGVPNTGYGFGDQTVYQSIYPRVSELDLNDAHFFAFWYFDDPANQMFHVHMWGKAGYGDELRHAEEDEGQGYINDWTYADARAVLIASGMPSQQAANWTPGAITCIVVGFGNDATSTAFDQTQARVYARNTMPSIAELEAIAYNSDADNGAWADWQLTYEPGGAVLADRSGNDRHLIIVKGVSLYQGSTFTFRRLSAIEVLGAGDKASSVTFGNMSIELATLINVDKIHNML